MTQEFPAPWTLRGNGYIFLYKFKNRLNTLRYPEYMQNKKFKGFGTVMCVDYSESNAGPYQELLFIPGKYYFRHEKISRKTYSIPQIYVSSIESVKNGQRNWGIPKKQAQFDIERHSSNREEFRVHQNGKVFYRAIFKRKGIPFPINSAFFPLPLTQIWENKVYLTKLKAKGKAYFTELEDIEVNSEKFLPVDQFKPTIVIKIENFTMQFLKADIMNI